MSNRRNCTILLIFPSLIVAASAPLNVFIFRDHRQPNPSTDPEDHFKDAAKAKILIDEIMEGLAKGTPGLWVRSVPIKELESIRRKASNDYGGEVRRCERVDPRAPFSPSLHIDT